MRRSDEKSRRDVQVEAYIMLPSCHLYATTTRPDQPTNNNNNQNNINNNLVAFNRLSKDDKYLKRKGSKQTTRRTERNPRHNNKQRNMKHKRGACANYVKLCETPVFLAFCAIATCAFFLIVN